MDSGLYLRSKVTHHLEEIYAEISKKDLEAVAFDLIHTKKKTRKKISCPSRIVSIEGRFTKPFLKSAAENCQARLRKAKSNDEK